MPEAGTRLNQKLDRIRGGNYRTRDFIIADAKDGDMGGGAGAMGLTPIPALRTRHRSTDPQ